MCDAKELADKYNLNYLNDALKSAILMDDKEETKLFKQAIKLKQVMINDLVYLPLRHKARTLEGRAEILTFISTLVKHQNEEELVNLIRLLSDNGYTDVDEIANTLIC